MPRGAPPRGAWKSTPKIRALRLGNPEGFWKLAGGTTPGTCKSKRSTPAGVLESREESTTPAGLGKPRHFHHAWWASAHEDSFPNSVWECRCLRNSVSLPRADVAHRRAGKQSFQDKCDPKQSLGTRTKSDRRSREAGEHRRCVSGCAPKAGRELAAKRHKRDRLISGGAADSPTR